MDFSSRRLISRLTVLSETPIQAAIKTLGLKVPTATLGHQKPKQDSIDHIAVPNSVSVVKAVQVDADGLSDHDAYVVEIR